MVSMSAFTGLGPRVLMVVLPALPVGSSADAARLKVLARSVRPSRSCWIGPLRYTLAPALSPRSRFSCQVPLRLTAPAQVLPTLRVMMLITPPMASEP